MIFPNLKDCGLLSDIRRESTCKYANSLDKSSNLSMLLVTKYTNRFFYIFLYLYNTLELNYDDIKNAKETKLKSEFVQI